MTVSQDRRTPHIPSAVALSHMTEGKEIDIDQEIEAIQNAHLRFRFERYRAGWHDTETARTVAKQLVDDLDVSPIAVTKFCQDTSLDVYDGCFLFRLYQDVNLPARDLE